MNTLCNSSSRCLYAANSFNWFRRTKNISSLRTASNIKSYSKRQFSSQTGPRPPRIPKQPIIWASFCILSVAAGIGSELWWFMKDDVGKNKVLTEGIDPVALHAITKKADESGYKFPKLPNDIVRERLSKLRSLKSPNELFDFFASITKSVHSSTQSGASQEKFMTPYDLLRALTLDFSAKPDSPTVNLSGQKEKFVNEINELLELVDINYDGLISREEFLFMLQLLETPLPKFKIAFRMFDLDGNGMLDIDEFKKVLNSQGVLHQLHHPSQPATSTISKSVRVPDVWKRKGLLSSWFGRDGSKKLSFEEFAQFLSELQHTVLRIQFDTYDRTKEGEMSPHDFAFIIFSHGYFTPLHEEFTSRYLTLPSYESGIRYTDFVEFDKFSKNLEELAVAIRLFTSTGKKMNFPNFYKICNRIHSSQEPLNQTVVDVIFRVFDKNGDGYLDYKDLVQAITAKASKGRSSSMYVLDEHFRGAETESSKLSTFFKCIKGDEVDDTV